MFFWAPYAARMTTFTPTKSHARRTAVSASAIADCPFSIAQEYATEYLEAAERGGSESTIHALMLPGIGYRVGLHFGLHFGVTEGHRQHDEIRFFWTSGSPLLPDFRGTLRFRIIDRQTQVIVEGSYVVPFGAIGRAFDAAVGRAIARGSLNDLARRIARTLAQHQAAWKASLPIDAQHQVPPQ
jgi:hypothetical protein